MKASDELYQRYRVVAPYCYHGFVKDKAYWIGVLHGLTHTKDQTKIDNVRKILDEWED